MWQISVDAPLKEAIDAVMYMAWIACVPVLLWLFVALLKTREEGKWKPRRRY